MPTKPTPPAVLGSHSLALLVIGTRSPGSHQHPSMFGTVARQARDELVAAGLSSAEGEPTPRGKALGEAIATAATYLQLTTSQPPAERQVWLAERKAVVATSTADGRWNVTMVPRGELWDHLVTWIYLGDRPQPARRTRLTVDGERLRAFIRALQQRDGSAIKRLRAETSVPTAVDDRGVFDAILTNRARCWLLRAHHHGDPQLVELAALDAGIHGWWRAWQRSTDVARSLHLDPIDTHEVWRSLAEALHGPPSTDDRLAPTAAPVS